MLDPIQVGLSSILFFVGMIADVWVGLSVLVYGTRNFEAYVATLASNVLLLPAYAVLVLRALSSVPAASALGIYVAVLAPGGPIANIFAVACSANSELNIVLTASEQLASVLMMPFGVIIVMPAALSATQILEVPRDELAKSVLMMVTPLLFGVLCGGLLEKWAAWWLPSARWHCQIAPRVFKRRIGVSGFLCAVAWLALAIIGTTGLVELPWMSAESEVADDAAASLTAGVKELRAELAEGGMALLRELLPAESLHAILLVALGFLGWGHALGGLVLPAQPAANRTSIMLEICVRDLGLLLSILTFGLPASLPLLQRLSATLSALAVTLATNLGVLLVLALAALLRGEAACDASRLHSALDSARSASPSGSVKEGSAQGSATSSVSSSGGASIAPNVLV